MAEHTLVEATQSPTLVRNAIGLTAVVFIAITTAGPALSTDSGLVVTTSYAGGATPLAVLLGTVAMLLVAVSLGQLGKHLPSAGGLSTYAVNGLGRFAGYITGWLLVLGYVLIPPLVVLVFSYVARDNLTAHFGAPTWIWAPIAVVVAVIGWALTFRGIHISTNAAVVLGALEILVFLAFAAYLIVDAGSRNTIQVFSPHLGNSNGMGSVFVAMIYVVLAFIGFDGAAAIAEETKQPKRNIPRALILAALAMGAFWLICYYGAVVYWGPAKIINPKSGFSVFNGGDPWSGMAQSLWGGAWVLVLAAVLISAFASSTGSIVAGSRIGYSLGRSSLLPEPIARIHPRFRTPYVTITLQALISVGVMLGLGFGIGGPQEAFAFVGTVITILFVVIYGLASAACCAYYLRRRRTEFNLLLHLVCPVLSVLFLIPVLIVSFGINFGGLGIAPLAGVTRWGPLVAAVWLVAGIGLMVWFRIRHPSRLASLGKLFGDDTPEPPTSEHPTISGGPSVAPSA